MGEIRNRYARILKKFPREFVLLKGTGCFHKKCLFCDYYLDSCDDPFPENEPILGLVTGEYGTLDIINSGSVHELDERTLGRIEKIVLSKKIHALWFEAHYAYHDQLPEIRDRFPGVSVKFRTGIESFDPDFRRRMNKGVSDRVRPEDVRRHFDGVCLLVGVEGQTKATVRRDIEIASSLFEYFSVNVFCQNSTVVKQDAPLVEWFAREVYPAASSLPNCEILLENTDLGVG
ncbi:MAG: hypothetical protein LBT08_09225 [Synergistaceae bacterium]|jgi:hypothetical protein|nr:hypothetical protein [Synergistaceae bacterium]